MALVLDPQEPAINRGIRTVGIGKKGSKPLTAELALEIVQELKTGKVSPAARGAFLAGLCAKGIEPQEEVLEQALGPGILRDPVRLLESLTVDAPPFARWACRQLLAGHTFDKKAAYDVGRFLFSDQPGDAARGWIASFLRVRYETDDEYAGLWQALDDTLIPAFKTPVPGGAPIIQLAEPFDGTDHSYMITPLIGRYLQGLGLRAVHQVGDNSGPKLEMNLWNIAQALGQKPAAANEDLALTPPAFGWFFHQTVMAPRLKNWVDIRRQIIKRPFLSTVERFVNPLKADILVTSCFHPPYGEKMLTLGQQAGFKGIIVIRNGIEGTIAFPLLRPVKLLLSARQKDGSFQNHEMTFEPKGDVDREEIVEKPSALHNATLIESYVKKWTSGNKHFDSRLESTCDGLKQALGWLEDWMPDRSIRA